TKRVKLLACIRLARPCFRALRKPLSVQNSCHQLIKQVYYLHITTLRDRINSVILQNGKPPHRYDCTTVNPRLHVVTSDAKFLLSIIYGKICTTDAGVIWRTGMKINGCKLCLLKQRRRNDPLCQVRNDKVALPIKKLGWKWLGPLRKNNQRVLEMQFNETGGH